MNRKIKAVIIIEIMILMGLFFHVARTPRMWVVLVGAILFTILASRSRARVFRMLSLIFWAISAMILFTAGWFWLAIIFPSIMCIIFWKNNPRESHQSNDGPFFQSGFENEGQDFVGRANGNDLIDLDDINFKPSGNSLSIKKTTGNTKIIVPRDVAVMLDVTTHTGVVKIFDEPSQINAGNIRYFSENIEEVTKRIKINIRVETGNIEVVQG